VRIGLDAGFDRRAAAWVLDLPGCVAVEDDERSALEAVDRRIETFTAWLGSRGETVAAPADEGEQVVERVESYLRQDGYEVNATFAADREPLTPDDVRIGLRWLGWAHGRFVDATFPFAEVALESEGRSFEDLVSHVLTAGSWLATRTEADQRAIAFPPAGAPLGERLENGFPFVDSYVARLAGGDGVRRRVDSKGEEWTARKVLRRLIYHALDHAEELERRRRRPAQASETR
jgi:hypothetical protein